VVLGGAEVRLVDGGLEQGFVVEPVTGGCAQVGDDRSPRSGLDERLATPSPSTRRAMVAALRASARAATISSWAVRLPSWFAATLASRESRKPLPRIDCSTGCRNRRFPGENDIVWSNRWVAGSGAGTTKAPGPDHSGHGAYQGRGLIPSSHQLMRRVSVSSSSSNASAYLSSYSE